MRLKYEEKEEEINKLKEKNMFLNKKIKTIEIRKTINNSIDKNNKSESISFIGGNQDFLDLCKKKSKKISIRNIKRNNNFSHYFNSSINNNLIHKKFIKRNMSLSSMNNSQIEGSSFINRKSTNENMNSMNKNISFCVNKIEENLNKNAKNSKNNDNKDIKYLKIVKKKVPINITNNNYNVQKNNVMINLDSINTEKMKIQKKLAEYRKLIDEKINSLRKINPRKINAHKDGKSFIKLKRDDSSIKLSDNNRKTKRENSYNFERKMKKN